MKQKSALPKVRLNLEITEKTRERLEKIKAAIEADSITEVIRRMAIIYETLLDARKHGKILFESVDGIQQELWL